VRYEDVVCDPSSVAGTLSKWLGLPFDPAMGLPHRSPLTAHTSSNEQVRRPVYTSSVGRWRALASSPSGGDEEVFSTAGAGAGDLEALQAAAEGFPGAAVLARLLSFEPVASRGLASTARDLVRDLPCAPRPSEPHGAHDARDYAADDARWDTLPPPVTRSP